MDLPSSIKAYFEADKGTGDNAPLRAFAPDAVVKDEGRIHRGHEAIAAWWRAAKAKYRHVAEPLEADEQNGQVTVRARVSGQFPGSPATLGFAFRLKGDKIVSLEITG